MIFWTQFTMPADVHLRDLVIAVVATLFLPLAVLGLDYFIRAKIEGGTWGQLVGRSGPDCCVLSMGATGTLFVDPNISSTAGFNSPLFIILLILFLIFMRVACINKDVARSEGGVPPNLRYGICSLLAICFVMVFGYYFAIFHPHSLRP
jgi:ABC-type Mn2+/Zn2+ transport system permease subunit